jgi:hypothetical protein
VKPGEVGATVGGQPAVVTLTDDNGSVIATVDGATVSYSVLAADGTKRPISVEAFSAIQPSDRLALTFTGFSKSAGKSRAWLAPAGVSLGEALMTSGNGTLESSVPNDLSAGDIRVIASAESEDGQQIVIAYGLKAEEKPSSGTPWSAVLFVVVGLAIVGGFIIPAARRRREEQK